ncbi:DUF5615 family PIN-like protein [bacterium]|nr:DUF5615 family PIN-like protein [bacterium]
MNLKVIMDVGVGKLSEDWLSQQGHDVLATRNINPRMGDDEILEIAAREGRLVITMDKDFGELVYRHKAANAGVLLLRLDDATSLEKVQIISQIFSEHEDKLFGSFSVYKNGRLRIHPQ